MAELAATAATDGLDLPRTVGAATLAALPETSRHSLAPFRGREAEVAAALGARPVPGAATALAGGRVVFAGLGVWIVEGVEPDPVLARSAAVTDQSDAWCGLALAGAGAVAVLARLVPLDLEPVAFAEGAAARTLLRHVPLLLVRTTDGFDLLVPRSCAATAVAEIVEAMARVAARAALDRGPGGQLPGSGSTPPP